MALIVKDRVKETTTTTGTGTVTLAGAASGFQAFSVIGDGNTTYYVIQDTAAGDWEVGIGTYTLSGTTLSRDTVLSSSNSGSLVNFGAGDKDVFVAYPSEGALFGGGNATIVVNQQYVADSYTIASGSNGFTVGPYTVGPGASVTLSGGQRWVVI